MKLLKEVDYGEYFLEVASKKQKTLAGGFIYLLSHLTWLYCEQMWLHKHDEEHPCRSLQIDVLPFNFRGITDFVAAVHIFTVVNDTLSPLKVHQSSSKIPSRRAGIIVGLLSLPCMFAELYIISFGFILNTHGRIMIIIFLLRTRASRFYPKALLMF